MYRVLAPARHNSWQPVRCCWANTRFLSEHCMECWHDDVAIKVIHTSRYALREVAVAREGSRAFLQVQLTLARLPSFFSSRSEVHTRSQTKGESSSLQSSTATSHSISVDAAASQTAVAAATATAAAAHYCYWCCWTARTRTSRYHCRLCESGHQECF